MKYLLFIAFSFYISTVFAQNLPNFNAGDQPTAPDYSKPENWSALPFRTDAADYEVVKGSFVSDSLKQVDVFYVYPTLYQKGKTWNADLQNHKLNRKLDRLPVKYQASVFNETARVYAPRYRQAIVKAFTDTTQNGTKALEFAYLDVKAAFEYYLKNYNNGRPIIIASHSQGTWHCRKLLKEYFDTPQMKARLICAYVIGFGLFKENYQILKPCENPNETNCYVSWASFKKGINYIGNIEFFGNVCVNPLTWTCDSSEVEGRGSVLLNIRKKKPYPNQTQIKGKYLWVKTKMPIVSSWRNLHLLDYNLFWFDIRKNVALRTNEYLKNKK